MFGEGAAVVDIRYGEDWRQSLENRFGAHLRLFFRRRTGSDDEARELTQEVFVRILAQERAGNSENPGAYIFTAAANLLREKWRRAAVRRTPIAGAVDTDIVTLIQPANDDLTPERIIASREMLDKVMNALDELGPKTRSIFVLYRIERMKMKEIARALGISVSSVEKHIAKALAHLVERVER